MNWGARIAILYVGFVCLILSLVFMSMTQKIELEEENYYEKEIAYESRIQAMRNASGVSPLKISIDNTEICITYPDEIASGLSGRITLFRPSDKSLDREFIATCDSSASQCISSAQLITGTYKLKMELQANNIDYYFEETVFVP